MNIFKVLSDGDGRIHEPNVSAFLASFLDPKQSHGIEGKLLELFLRPLAMKYPDDFDFLLSEDSSKMTDLSLKSNFDVRVQPEKTVKAIYKKGPHKRSGDHDIDIVIEMRIEQDGHAEELPLVVCVENKIRDGSVRKGSNQLIQELDGLISHLRKNPVGSKPLGLPPPIPTIAFIFLTRDYSSIAIAEYNDYLSEAAKRQGNGIRVFSAHLVWSDIIKDNEQRQMSVYYQLAEILQLDSHGEIDPLHEHTKYIIKSFMSFVKSGFRSYREETKAAKKDYSKYEYNGTVYGKGQLVRAVIKEHVERENPTLKALRDAFPETIMPNHWRLKGVVCRHDEAPLDRYFIDDLKTSDNPPVSIAVNRMWDLEGITAFIDQARKCKHVIKKVEKD
jgi:hypothetical protein